MMSTMAPVANPAPVMHHCGMAHAQIPQLSSAEYPGPQLARES